MFRLNKITTKSIVINLLIPFLLLLPILWFTLPAVFFGTDSLNMIKHFDIDEGNLVEFAGKTYSSGIIPIEDGVAYPQLFNYLAGLVLFPLTFLKGINYKLIVIVLRSLNMLAGILTSAFLYYFCLRFFKSIWAGILSSLFFILTPTYLCWLLNSRPHPLELLFLLSTLYFCFKLTERYSIKFLFGAVIFAGLAMATKYGGLFMILTIWLSTFYGIRQFDTSLCLTYLKSKFKLIFGLSLCMVVFAILTPISVSLFYLHFPKKFKVFEITDFNAFVHFRDFRLMLLASTLLLGTGVIWWMVNFFASRLARSGAAAEKYRKIFVFDLAMLFLFFIAFGVFAIFFIFNPSYLLFPVVTMKRVVLQTAISTLTTNLNPALHKPIIDPNSIIWLKMLFEDLFNTWFTIVFAVCLAYELLKLKEIIRNDQKLAFQKGLLFVNSLILFLFLFVFLAHRTHHYLLPVSLSLGIFLSLKIVEITKSSKKAILRLILLAFFVPILTIGFIERFNILKKLRNYYIGRNSQNNVAILDTGLLIGGWLKNNYSPQIKIWKDCEDFYVPDRFKNVYFKKEDINIEDKLLEIKRIAPDILIITSKFDETLANNTKVAKAMEDGVLKGYKQIRSYNYQGSLTLKQGVGRYKEIFIYARN